MYDGTGKLVRKGQSSWASSGEIDRFVLHLEEKNPTSFEYELPEATELSRNSYDLLATFPE
ncbi:hypothetical protein [Leptospira sp. mild_001]|uniref:hypothetical protein n=1 Tax=Leptospira sp. mild_001 TaxID=2838238 RepID=UPI001E48A27E|nr:hypothetical protein [Leptospira sp. mild_001]